MEIEYKFVRLDVVEHATVDVPDDAIHQVKVKAVMQEIANKTGERVCWAIVSSAAPYIRMGTEFIDPAGTDLDGVEPAIICSVEEVSIYENGTWNAIAVNPDR